MGFVQRLGHADATFVTSLPITLAATATAGNTVIMGVRVAAGAGITSISDSRGNTWAVDKSSAASGSRSHICRTAMDGGVLQSGDTITVNISAANNALAAVMEYTGIVAAPFDASAANNGSGLTIATGATGTTAQANEIAVTIAGWNVGEASVTTPTGYTDRDTSEKNTSNGGLAFADKVLSATGTENPSWTWGTSATVGAVVATYKTTGTITHGFESGANGATITAAGSGGDTAFDNVTVSGTGSTATYDNSHVHAGTLAGKFAVAGTSGVSYAQWSQGSIGSPTTLFVRLYVWLLATPTGAGAQVWRSQNGANLTAAISIDTAGLIQFRDANNASMGASSSAVPTGQWIRIEAKIVCGAGTGTAELRYYTAPDSTTPTQTLGPYTSQQLNTAATFVRYGAECVSIGSPVATAWVDDVGFSTVDWFGPSLTSVTTTASSTWSVRQAVVTSKASTWNTAQAVVASKSSTWSVRQAVASTASSTWSVRQAVAASQSSTWQVRQAVSTSQSSTWAVRQAVANSASSTWAVRQQITTTGPSTWNVRQAVTANQASTWNVGSTVSTSQASTWSVRVAVATSQGSTWSVAQRLTQTADSTWVTAAQVTATSPSTWNVAATVSQAAASTWAVRQAVSTSQQSTWDVASALISVTTSQSSTWQVLAPVVASQQSTWNVRATQSNAVASLWNLTVPVAKTQQSTWSVRQSVTAVRDSRWAVAVLVTASHLSTWRVFPAVYVTTPTPVDRTSFVLAEVRSSVVARELRVSVVPAEPRLDLIPADPRATPVLSERRLSLVGS